MGTVRCKIIGVIHFVDGGEIDYKIIAVDADFQDIKSINEISDLKKTFTFSSAEAQIYNWLKYYKTVDNDRKRIANPEKKHGKYILNRPTDANEAKKVIKECRQHYEVIVNNETKQDQKEYKNLKWSTPVKQKE